MRSYVVGIAIELRCGRFFSVDISSGLVNGLLRRVIIPAEEFSITRLKIALRKVSFGNRNVGLLLLQPTKLWF